MTAAERLAQYEDLFEKSQAYDPAQFKQDFERAYGETTGYNQDIINQQGEALGSLQAVAPQLRQRYSESFIKNPTLQRSLIAQARKNPITAYSNATNLLTQRGQRFQDILSNALSGYESAASQAQTAAENAWRLYQDAVQQEQFNRQNRPGPSIEEILANLPGGDDFPPNDDEGPDITVDDRAWDQKLLESKIGGYDINSEKYQQLSPLRKYTTLLNPLTGIKTFGGIAGDLIARARLGDKYILDRGKTGSRGSTW